MEELLKEILQEIRKSQSMTLTTEEVAEQLNTYSNKVNAWREAGLIKAIKKGRGYIYTRKEVEKFLDRWNGEELPNISEIERKKV